MGLLNKKDEDLEPLEGEELDAVAPEPEPEPEPEPDPTQPALGAAHDAARVCALINQAVQNATALAGGTLPQGEELQQLQQQAAGLAARAHGTWEALAHGALEAQAQAAEQLGVFADRVKLAELSAAVIVDAREQLQQLLGQVDDGAPSAE